MAKPNYAFEKRQRELAKKKKKEEKQKERRTEPGQGAGHPDDNAAPAVPAPADGPSSS